MHSKKAINSIVSLLGSPLHGEMLDIVARPHTMRVCFQVNHDFNFPRSISMIIKEECGRETLHALRVEYRSHPLEMQPVQEVWSLVRSVHCSISGKFHTPGNTTRDRPSNACDINGPSSIKYSAQSPCVRDDIGIFTI